MGHTTLLQAAKKITTYLANQIEGRQHESLEAVLQLMQTTQQMFPQWVLQVCPYRHPNLKFITSNCKNIFGYEPEELREERHKYALFSHIHQDDIDELYQCFAFVELYIKSSDQKQLPKTRFTFSYRIRHKSGAYLVLHDEKATIKINDALSLQYTLFKENHVLAFFPGVKVDVYEEISSLKKILTYKPSSAQLEPSKRENEILQLMHQGLTNVEIAKKLAVSTNRIGIFRRKFYIRYCIPDTIELVNKA